MRSLLAGILSLLALPALVSSAAAEEGLTYAVDKMTRQPNTLDCHRLILWAQPLGKSPQMKQKLMELYFTEGADLSDREVLIKAAAEVGLNADEVRAKLATDGLAPCAV